MLLSQGENNEHTITTQPPESFIHQSSEWVRAKAYEDIPEGFFENPGLVMRSSLRDTRYANVANDSHRLAKRDNRAILEEWQRNRR